MLHISVHQASRHYRHQCHQEADLHSPFPESTRKYPPHSKRWLTVSRLTCDLVIMFLISSSDEFVLVFAGGCQHRLLHEWVSAEVKGQQEAGEEAVVRHQRQSPVHIRCKRGKAQWHSVMCHFNQGEVISWFPPNVCLIVSSCRMLLP